MPDEQEEWFRIWHEPDSKGNVDDYAAAVERYRRRFEQARQALDAPDLSQIFKANAEIKPNTQDLSPAAFERYKSRSWVDKLSRSTLALWRPQPGTERVLVEVLSIDANDLCDITYVATGVRLWSVPLKQLTWFDPKNQQDLERWLDG